MELEFYHTRANWLRQTLDLTTNDSDSFATKVDKYSKMLTEINVVSKFVPEKRLSLSSFCNDLNELIKAVEKDNHVGCSHSLVSAVLVINLSKCSVIPAAVSLYLSSSSSLLSWSVHRVADQCWMKCLVQAEGVVSNIWTTGIPLYLGGLRIKRANNASERITNGTWRVSGQLEVRIASASESSLRWWALSDDGSVMLDCHDLYTSWLRRFRFQCKMFRATSL